MDKTGVNTTVTTLLPLKPLYNLTKRYYHGDISRETLLYFRDLLTTISTIITTQTITEFNHTNTNRQLQGLPPLKRLDATSIKTVGERILNQITNKNTIGEVGHHNTTLLHRDGVSNETKT